MEEFNLDTIDHFRALTVEVGDVRVGFAHPKGRLPIGEPIVLQFARRSIMCWRDLYKAILQGTCGWAHLRSFADTKGILDYLAEELINCGTADDDGDDGDEELFELLEPKTGLGRLNLRPWKLKFGVNAAPIWDLMQLALPRVPESTDLFVSRWKEVITMHDQGILVSSLREEEEEEDSDKEETESKIRSWLDTGLQNATNANSSEELLTVSHSPSFREEYRPAYRIVHESDVRDL